MRIINPLDVVQMLPDGHTVWTDRTIKGIPLRCTRHENDGKDIDKAWCEDIQSITQNGADAKQLWEIGVDHDMIVPVMPSEGIFEYVLLTEVDDTSPMCEVRWLPYDDPFDDRFLGYFSPGEGRTALRQMLLNQLDMEFASIEKCTHSGHGLPAEREWQNNELSTKMGFVNRFYVMKHGKCKYCFRSSAARNDDDLIPGSPESDAKSFWSSAEDNRVSRRKALDAAAAGRAARRSSSGGYVSPLEALKDKKEFKPMFQPSTKDDQTNGIF